MTSVCSVILNPLQCPTLAAYSQRLKQDREAVKTLAIAVGVREAARQLGLNENRVLKWSERGKWFKDIIVPKPPNQSDVITVIKPSEAMRSTLEDDSRASKLGYSKAGRKVAEKLGRMDEDELILPETAQSAKQWYGISAGIHTWEKEAEGSGVFPKLSVYSQQTVLNVQVNPEPQGQPSLETGDAKA